MKSNITTRIAAVAMLLAAAVSLADGVAHAATQVPSGKVKNFDCKPVPAPIRTLSFGSRYTADSKTRSDFDDASNDEVNKALKPIEEYISQLSKMANAAVLSEENRQKRVDCAATWLAAWADADAFGDLQTMTAKLAIPARFAGLAFAYGQAKSAGRIDEAAAGRIEAWLRNNVERMVTFFDSEAPKKASKNNLRLWAGLAATETGLVTGTPSLVAWGAQTNEMVVCASNPDGSLPLEMGRGRLALHYQLHAVGPMILTATLLEEQGRPGFSICGGKIETIVDFTMAALKDPSIVDAIAGTRQSFSAGKEKVNASQMAWAEPYLRRFQDAELDTFVKHFRPMAHAKLGGNLTAIYAR
ncbi:N/A [soil metagenome]